MNLYPVTQQEYANIIPAPFHVFNTVAFNELNADKVDKVHYLLFQDSKYRLGLVAGEKDGRLRSPFSAPFGGFSYVKEEVSVEQMDGALTALKSWAVEQGCSAIQITLPPLLYGESYLSKWVNAFYRAGFEVHNIDLNYAFHLESFDEDYPQNIRRNARKNLKAAQKAGFDFQECETAAEKARAYEVIRQNRTAKGYPLRMSWEQVTATIQFINAHFFLLQYKERDVAAALVFEVTPAVMQVIYWGEIVDYSHLRPMNYLSWRLFAHLKDRGMQIADIGPSTEDSVPNHGLCEFKESIGCEVGLKMTFTLTLS